ncbi:MAG: peptide chain release factor 2 [Spirochaetes bacterium GWF1_51_8]|nr:MAG: peptide chain release factor 2 [Spirochaetes bacterium GWF1_51_8]
MENRVTEIEKIRLQLNDEKVWSDHKLSSKLNSEMSNLEREIEDWKVLRKDIDDLLGLVELTESEGEDAMIAELQKNYDSLTSKLSKLEIEMIFSGENDTHDAFLNIHPGAGGTESQDWGDMLLRMYMRWAELNGFKAELVDYEPGEGAGLKDATIYFKGKHAYGYLQAENGIHRLVRLSPFNANNKRQTSFCAVSVIPEVDDEIKIEVKDDDIRIDTFRASGAGGQHVNKTSSAIRITHFPTGIVVTCQNERSQFQNKDLAMKVLRSRIYDYERDKRDREEASKMPERKSIEWGNQIRSYVFQPYTLVKDHRTDIEKGNIQAVMDGEIQDFIVGYLKSIKMKNT